MDGSFIESWCHAKFKASRICRCGVHHGCLEGECTHSVRLPPRISDSECITDFGGVVARGTRGWAVNSVPVAMFKLVRAIVATDAIRYSITGAFAASARCSRCQ